MLTDIINGVLAKKAELDRLRPGGGLSNLEHSHDLELIEIIVPAEYTTKDLTQPSS